MDQFLAVLATVFTVIITAVTALATVRRDVSQPQSRFKLTFWAVVLIFLSIGVIGISIYLSFNDIRQKKEAQGQVKVVQDSLFKVVNNINQISITLKNSLGIAYNQQSKNIYVVDSDRLVTGLKQLNKRPDQRVPDTIPPSELTYRDIVESERIRKAGDHLDEAIARCIFINKTGVAIKMYRGIATSNNTGVARAVLDIAPGKSASTDDIEVGQSLDKGPVDPPTSNFDFYFVTTDTSTPRRYGKINIRVLPYKEAIVVIDNDNLNLTTSGPRDNSYLRDAGVN